LNKPKLVEKEVSKIAICSCILGILTWMQIILVPIALAFGIVAIFNIRKNNDRLKGYAFAIVGIGSSIVMLLVLSVLFWIRINSD